MISYLILFFILSKSDFEINGFSYRIVDDLNQTNTVQIVNCSNKFDKNIQIFPKVTYESIDYTVISISSSAFSSTNISQFEIIYLPSSLLEIEDRAFSNFRNLNMIGYINEDNYLTNNTLPPLLTKINDNVFSYCKMLTTIDTNNVIELGTSCFQFCIRLTTLKLRSVEIIGPYSLASIQLLNTIELPQNLREIQSYAFAKSAIVTITGEVPNLQIITTSFFGCSDLESIPKLTGIIELQSSTFSNCRKLKEVHCGSNLTTIYSNCFTSCSSLEYFTTSSDNYFISMEAFSQCSSLKKFNFSGVTEILNNAFEGCISFDVIDMSNSQLEIISPIFQDCGDLSSVILPPNLSEFNLNIFEGSNVHSVIFSGTKGTIDLTGAFFECRFDLYEVIFAPSCRANFFATFASCYHLSRVVLPTEPYSLYDTFSHCLNLTEVKNIEFCISLDYAFFSCEKLTHFDTFPQLTNLGNQTFMNCKSLQSFPYLPSLKIIGKNCFKNCFSLKSFQCGEDLEVVGAESFYECLLLENFSTLSKSYSIEPVAFQLCKSLKTFDFSRCNRIDFGAFIQCKSLIEVDLSKTNLKSLTFLTFSECTSLKNVIFPVNLESVEEECFLNCVSLELLDFSNSSENLSIFENAFEFCIGLKTVKFNKQPFVISRHAFYSCISLESVYLMSSESSFLSQIEDGAFENCTSLKKFEFEKWSITTIDQYAFYGCPLSDSIKFNGACKQKINLSISSHAFTSPNIKSIDFRFDFSFLNLNEKSFFECENVKCVMIDYKQKDFVSSFFDDYIINGFHCSNFISTHLAAFCLFVSLAVFVIACTIVIIVCVIRRRRQKRLNNSQPLLTTQSTQYN